MLPFINGIILFKILFDLIGWTFFEILFIGIKMINIININLNINTFHSITLVDLNCFLLNAQLLLGISS